MRIPHAKVLGLQSWTELRNSEDFDGGRTYGLGDATLNGARRIEDTWQYLYEGACWRRGLVTISAMEEVDTALRGVKARF